MTINESVVRITMEGNVKDAVSHDKHTYIASFEPLDQLTVIYVKVAPVAEKEAKPLIDQIEERFKQYGEVISGIYLKDGCQIIYMGNNN